MHRMRNVILLTVFLVLGVLIMIHTAWAESSTGRLRRSWSPSDAALAPAISPKGMQAPGVLRTTSGGPLAYAMPKTGAVGAVDEHRALLPIVMSNWSVDSCPPVSFTVAVSGSVTGTGFAYGIGGDAFADQDHDRLFVAVQQLGSGWYKQQISWATHNPAPGQYDWTLLDTMVANADSFGIQVLVTVRRTPQWAKREGDTNDGPPADNGTLATFLREMAGRYRGRVQAYEIWSEQNLCFSWGGLGNKLDAGEYVALLTSAYSAIKAVDPNAYVVSGGLSATGFNDGNIAIDDPTYLGQMYDAGLSSCCDAVGARAPGYNQPPDADWRCYEDPTAVFTASGHPSWFFQGTLQSYRDIMVNRGDAARPIWVTSFGWPSIENVAEAPNPGCEYAADNSEEEQAQYSVLAYQMAKQSGWIGPMFLWNLNLAPLGGPTDPKSAYSIVRQDWGPRPAFTALSALTK